MTTKPRRWPLALLLTAAIGVLGCLAHANWARGREDGGARARGAVRVLGFADLALSSTSRWLRTPTQAEPAAAALDGPGWLDTDPAGGFIAPPRDLLPSGARPPRIERRGDR